MEIVVTLLWDLFQCDLTLHIRSLFSDKIHLIVIAFLVDSCYYTKTLFYSISVHRNTPVSGNTMFRNPWNVDYG